jgi:hypothetical protein
MYTKLFEFKKWLNMEPKTDKENRSCDDIAFLSEIIANSRYWQDTSTSSAPQTGPENTIYHKWPSKEITQLITGSVIFDFCIGT